MGKKRKSQATSEVDEIVDDKKKVKKTKCTENKKNKINENPDCSTVTTQPFEVNKSDCSKPKKIIFVDDQPQEVPVIQDKKKNKRRKSNHESDSDILREEDVKDEDIDKFCDELNEEDNKQYESWVQLIEANLSSNKKKPK